MKATLIRYHKDPFQVFGKLILSEGGRFITEFWSLELCDRDNNVNVSCIPEGEYTLQKDNSFKHGNHFRVLDVKDRTGILIHVANRVDELKGCIAIGTRFSETKNSLVLEASKEALDSMYDLVKSNLCNLTIIEI